MTEDVEEKDRSFVTALARGLEVLRVFQPGETYLTNQEIARRADLPKPTVSRLTHTLLSLGYLAQDEATGAYRLDAGVLALGFGVLSSVDIADRARGELERLRTEVNPFLTCGLVERVGIEAVYLSVSQSTKSVVLRAHPGARLPLLLSAGGLAILAAESEDVRDAALAALRAAFPHKHSEAKAALDAARADLAACGYVRAYKLWRGDVHGVATPVRSLCGARLLALNAGGPSFLVPTDALEAEFAPKLLEAAKRLDPTR